MNGSILLDSNFVAALFKEDSDAQAVLATASDVFIPSIVLGELYFGARKSGRPAENLARVDSLAAASDVLVTDVESARSYGLIRDDLRRKGRPITDNDIWIAAIARQHDLTLITRDAHFQEIEGLSTGSW